MLKNNFKIAIRSLLRQKGFSFINILGLTVGLTCSLLMLLWVQQERSYDAFHTNLANIYQLKSNVKFGDGAIQTWSGTPYPYSVSLANDYPEVEGLAIATYDQEHLFTVDTKKGKEQGLYANAALFKLFDFPFVEGNPNKALDNPTSMVLSQKLAKKYFGNSWQSAIGQAIQINEKETYQISGIFADIPANSSIQFDYILPFKKLLAENTSIPEKYGDYNYRIYVQLQAGTDQVALLDNLLSVTSKKLANSVYSVPDGGFILHPFKDTYLYNSFENGKAAGGRIDFVRLFFLAALFVLFLACINYMNLATAKSSQRAKEVGIRKVIGAGKNSLIIRFFTEAFVMTFVAIALAVGLVHLLLPSFNQLASTAIPAQFNQFAFWGLIGSVLLGTTFLTGSYPAFLLSSFKIDKVLKGELSTGLNAATLRKGLVVFQFLISALLIMGAVSMRQQMHFMQNKDLGMDKNNMIVAPANEHLVKQYQVLKEKLNQHPAIASVSAASENPIRIGSSTGDPEWEGFTEDKRTIFKRLVADYNFIESMKIPLVEGRYPSKERTADSTAILVNEATARAMEMDNPVGKTLTFWGTNWNIVGMVKDFHLNSLHESIPPLVVVHNDEWINNIYIRPTQGKTKEAIAALKEVYTSLSPAYPMEYSFLDKEYEALYKSEQTTGALADLFALIALFISALGLLGLAAFSAEQRIKEIGIRKVLGASVFNLVGLLSKDFIRLVLLAFVIAIPIAWYSIHYWLQNFAYHIDIHWSIFAIPIALTLFIALVTVGFQAFKAAIANPIKAIKSE